jgi:hypothetical protein
MASEDSDHVMPGLLAVHRLNDFRNIRQTLMGLVDSCVNQLNAAGELLEIPPLRCSQWMFGEERNNLFDQIRPTPHSIAKQVFFVVVVPPVWQYVTRAEELHEIIQAPNALCTLGDYKLVRHLVASFVAFPTRPIWLPDEADGEATLSVYKTNNPTKLNQPFLLVFCTHRIVTIPPTSDGIRSVRYSGFPAYSRMHTVRLPVRGATNYLRTVPTVTTWTEAQAVGAFLADSHGRP